MKVEVGRNDPCPCGSGKKYKKCCLPKDEQARQEQRSTELIRPAAAASAKPATAASKPKLPARPPDPYIEAWNARWEEFEARDYEGQLALFAQTLEEGELMDGEMAFEMLNVIFGKTVERNERDRFDALVESLRQRRPEVYDKEAHWCLEWLITNALVAGRYELVLALARALAPLAGKQIDGFNRVIDQLAYHGQLSAIIEAMRLAWPQVKKSSDIVPWGIDEFSRRGIDCELLDYVEHAAVPDPSDPALIARLEFFGEIERERLAPYLAYLTGQAERRWTLDDFTFAPQRRRSRRDFDEEDEEAEAPPPEPTGELNLFFLSVEFLGYLRREEGVPYAKGELGRHRIVRFILRRHAGELEYEESMLEAMQRSQERKPKPKPKFRPFEHLLCPDYQRLDRFLGGLLDFINPQHYEAAATFELMPAWLRFLESRHLIDAPQHARTLSVLRGMSDSLLKLWKNYSSDPALYQAMQHCRAQLEQESNQSGT